MPRHHSILISPGRFPSLDGASSRPGDPKPRIPSPLDGEAWSVTLEEVRR